MTTAKRPGTVVVPLAVIPGVLVLFAGLGVLCLVGWQGKSQAERRLEEAQNADTSAFQSITELKLDQRPRFAAQSEDLLTSDSFVAKPLRGYAVQFKTDTKETQLPAMAHRCLAGLLSRLGANTDPGVPIKGRVIIVGISGGPQPLRPLPEPPSDPKAVIPLGPRGGPQLLFERVMLGIRLPLKAGASTWETQADVKTFEADLHAAVRSLLAQIDNKK